MQEEEKSFLHIVISDNSTGKFEYDDKNAPNRCKKNQEKIGLHFLLKN